MNQKDVGFCLGSAAEPAFEDYTSLSLFHQVQGGGDNPRQSGVAEYTKALGWYVPAMCSRKNPEASVAPAE